MAMLIPHSFDIIHASSFFQLFSWSGQAEALSLALRLLKSKPGSMMFGRQTGTAHPETIRYKSTRTDEMFRHNADSFKLLLEEIAAKAELNVAVDVESYRKPNQGELEHWLLLKYCIVLL